MQSFSHQQMGAKNVSRPAKAALICQILRRLIAQYCTMNKRRRVTEGHGCIVVLDGEGGGDFFFNQDGSSCVGENKTK